MADRFKIGIRRLLAASGADRRHAIALTAGVVLAAGVAVPAFGQGWWPFGGNEAPRERPAPREPVYQEPGYPEDGYRDDRYQERGYGEPGAGQRAPPPAQGYAGGRSPICLELEQRLVQDGKRGGDSRTLVPMVENEMRQAEQAYRNHKQQLDRSDCYEFFLFSKTLRRTRRCVDLANQADEMRRRVDDLEVQLGQLQASSGRSHQDEIVRELARNNCGANYQQQARRQSGGGIPGFWEDEESSGSGGSSFGALPYATYRTVCVRLCDGYYFPVSFSTLPNHFQRDEEVCSSKCAAPAQLYYHQNPGAGMDQAMAAGTNEAYTQLKTAFKYRKEYVAGCSCKMAEYKPEPGAVQGNAGGWTAQTPTGSAAQSPPEAPAQAPPGSSENLPWATTP